MKLVILYHLKDEFSTMVENFADDCKKRTNREINLVDVDSREGTSLATVYGIVNYPAELVTKDDGQLMKYWEGSELPLYDEVMGYLNA